MDNIVDYSHLEDLCLVHLIKHIVLFSNVDKECFSAMIIVGNVDKSE